MKITYLGTTMLLFDDGVTQVLFDCHITRPSLLQCQFGKFETDAKTAEQVLSRFPMDRLEAIFISHTHHDHVMDAPYFAVRTGAKIIGSASAMKVAEGGFVPAANCLCYDDSMEYRIGDFHVKILPSIHSKAHWYNNDLGKTIDEPLEQPAKKKQYKEGGSVDFVVENGGKTYVIRPSYNFIPGQLDGIKADVLFLGVGGLSKDSRARQQEFFKETVDKVQPRVVVPVHWDFFFTPLFEKIRVSSGFIDNGEASLAAAQAYCDRKGIRFFRQLPLTTTEL